MKHPLACLLLLATGLVSAMTPAEFSALYEKPGKTAADCYKLFEAYRDGDGTEKDTSKARKWVLAAHEAGMISARKDISTLPWRTGGRYKGKPSVSIAEVDDDTAKSLGEELISLLSDYYGFTGGISLQDKPADKETLKEVRRLITEGADLNVWKADSMRQQHSALYLACMNNDLRLAKILIDHGADPSANNNQAITVSFESDHAADAEKYEKEIEEGMEKAGLDDGSSMRISRKELRKMKAREKKSGKETRSNSVKLFSFLLANGADVSLYTNHGWTLMYTATLARSSQGIAMLAKAGLDPMTPQNPHEYVQAAGVAGDMDYRYQIGYVAHRGIPIHFAVDNAMPFVVNALLKAGTDANAKDHEGKTPMVHAQEGLAEIKENPANPNYSAFVRRYQDIIAGIRKAGGKASQDKAKN